MKKISIILITVILTLFISCATEADTALFTLSIDDECSPIAGRGISGVVMDTDHYVVSITGNKGNYDFTLERGVTVLKERVLVGEYDVTVSAKNREDQNIGIGTAKLTVLPFGENTVSVTVSEIKGAADLKVEVKSVVDLGEVILKVWNSSSDYTSAKEDYSVVLSKTETGYSGQISLNNGYYAVIVYSDGKAIAAPEIVRMVASYATRYGLTLSDSGDVSIDINNIIGKTPEIHIAGAYHRYIPGEKISLNAETKNMKPITSWKWYLDENLMDTASGPVFSLDIPADGRLRFGTHSITCIAYDGEKSWSENIDFVIVDPSDKPTEIKVSGNVRFALIGDVLIPEATEASIMTGGNSVALLNSNDFDLSVEFNEPSVITVELLNVPGYTYYFEERHIDGETVIAVVIDKAIENPAYVKFIYNQDFSIAKDCSIGFWLDGTNSLYPYKTEDYMHRAYIPLQNWLKERTIKVEADTYSYVHYYNDMGNNPFIPKLDKREWTSIAGEYIEVTVTNTLYAEVPLYFPGLENGRVLTIDDGSTGFRLWTVSPVDGRCTLYTHPEYQPLSFVAVSSDSGKLISYESEAVSVSPGLNPELKFTEKEPNVTATGLSFEDDERIRLEFDIRAAVPANACMFITTGGEIQEYMMQDDFSRNRGIHTLAAGNLSLVSTRLEGYEITCSETTDESGRYVNVVIDLPAEKRIPVQINYDFAYDANDNANIYPLITADGSSDYLMIQLKGGRDTVNIASGDYISSSSIWSIHGDSSPIKFIYVKEKNFKIAADGVNTITMTYTNPQ